jgi:hypothetical protein
MSARPPAACALTPPVEVDVRLALERARSGLGDVRPPSGIERAARRRLEDPGELLLRRRAFDNLAPDVQQAQIGLWWRSQPESRRETWLASWPKLVSDAQRDAWLDATPDVLSERDLTIARLEVWLAQQPPEIQYEVERWWELVDSEARKAAIEHWRATLNAAYREWLDARLPSSDPETKHRLMRGARILAWWDARDRREQRALERWWMSEQLDERRHAVAAWLRTLPLPAQVGARWPDASQLTPAERRRRLEAVPELMPERLWPDFFAWQEWHALTEAGGEALDEVLDAEVGGFTRFLTAFRFAVRPLDVAIGFRLPVVAPLVLAMFVVGVVLVVRLRRRRDQLVIPSGEPPGAG